MRYIRCKQPGQWEQGEKEIPKPQPHEALVQIKKMGICGTDLHAFKGNQAFFNYPRILGHELAGIIQEVPQQESTLKKGDRVAILPYLNCKACEACLEGKTNCCEKLQVLGVHVDGGMQDYMALPQSHLIPLANLSLEAIALIEPLSIGAHALRRANLQKGNTLFVMGCGPIGVGLMLLAKNKGFKVLALDQDPQRLAFVQDQLNLNVVQTGAEAVAQLKQQNGGQLADVVFDATGNRAAMESGPQFMRHGGTYVLVGLYKDSLSFKHPEIHAKETSLLCSRNATREDFEAVIETLQNNSFPVEQYITHHLDFEELPKTFKNLYNSPKLLIKALVTL